jgi:hypothetical protein
MEHYFQMNKWQTIQSWMFHFSQQVNTLSPSTQKYLTVTHDKFKGKGEFRKT